MQDNRSDFALGLDLAASRVDVNEFDSDEMKEGYVAGLRILSGFTRDVEQLGRALACIDRFPEMHQIAINDETIVLIEKSLVQLNQYIAVAQSVAARVKANNLIKLSKI